MCSSTSEVLIQDHTIRPCLAYDFCQQTIYLLTTVRLPPARWVQLPRQTKPSPPPGTTFLLTTVRLLPARWVQLPRQTKPSPLATSTVAGTIFFLTTVRLPPDQWVQLPRQTTKPSPAPGA